MYTWLPNMCMSVYSGTLPNHAWYGVVPIAVCKIFHCLKTVSSAAKHQNSSSSPELVSLTLTASAMVIFGCLTKPLRELPLLPVPRKIQFRWVSNFKNHCYVPAHLLVCMLLETLVYVGWLLAMIWLVMVDVAGNAKENLGDIHMTDRREVNPQIDGLFQKE